MTNPLVSVVIPVHNAEAFLRETLHSVLAQTYRPIEVIAVDDGSTDHSADILSDYNEQVRVVTQANCGPAAARNRGIAECRGEWVAFVDADDLWDPLKLESEMRAAGPGDAIVHTNARVIDERGRVIKEYIHKIRGGSLLVLKDLLYQNHVPMLTAVVRIGALDAVGGFDAANRLGAEDWQLWLSLAAAGYRFCYVDAVTASYRRHGNNISGDECRMAEGRIVALRSIRARYPKAFGKAELLAYHDRLSRIHFGVGWHLYDRGDYAAAAKHFRQAVVHKPTFWKSWPYAAVTTMPGRRHLVPMLRRLITRSG